VLHQNVIIYCDGCGWVSWFHIWYDQTEVHCLDCRYGWLGLVKNQELARSIYELGGPEALELWAKSILQEQP